MTLPGRGETVGEAFIRILADGSRLGRSIRDEFRGQDAAYKKFGRDGAATYNKAFDAENDRWLKRTQIIRFGGRDRKVIVSNVDKLTRDINAAMRRSKAKFDATGQFLAGGWAAKFKETIRKEVGDKDLADQIFRNISLAAEKAGSRDLFFHRVSNLGPEIARARDQILAEEKRIAKAEKSAFRARLALADKFERDLAKLTRPRHDIFGTKETERFEEHFGKLIRQIKDESTSVGAADRKLRLLVRAEHELTRASDDLASGFARVDRRLRGIGKDRNVFRSGLREVKDFERHLTNLDTRVRNLRIGRLFGEGSRNDFFNILGKITGRLAEFTILAGVRAVRSVVRFGSGFNQANGPMGKFTFTMRVLDGLLFKFVKTLGGVGVGLAALQLIGGPIAAFISTLAGAVTALASTIVVGLIGAIGAALPIMGVFAASLGVIGLAFAKGGKTYAEWKKDLDRALKPVTSQFHELQDAARKGLFGDLNTQGPKLAGVLGKLEPLITKVGRALSHAFTGFLDALGGKQFDKNLRSMNKFFPEAIEKLGKVFTNVFGGIAGTMRALVPIANKLLDSWVKGSRQFRRFANSATGQNKLKKWFDDAYDSGRKVYKFIKLLGTVLLDLFTLGAPTGDNIFDSMNRSLREFDHWLNSGGGKDSVRGWFADSRDMLTHLGNFVSGVSHLFGRLASGGQGSMNGILDGLGRFADLIAAALPTIQDFLSSAGEVIGKFLEALTSLFHFISSNEDAFKPLIETLGILWAAWKGYTILTVVGSAFATFGANIAPVLANIGAMFTRTATTALTSSQRMAGIATGLGIGVAGTVVGNQVGGAGGKAISIGSGVLGGALVGSVFGPEGAVIGGAVGGLTSAIASFWNDSSNAAEDAQRRQEAVVNAIITANEEAKAAQKALTASMLSNLQQVGAKLDSAIHRTAVIGQLNAKGALTLAEKAGISGKDLVDVGAGTATQAETSKLFTRILQAGAKGGPLTPQEARQLIQSLSDVEDATRDATNQFILEQRAAGKGLIAHKNLGNSLEKLRTALKGADRALLDASGGTDDLTASSIKSREKIREETEAIGKNVKIQLQHGKSVQEVASNYERQIGTLVDNLQQMGFNRKAVVDLVGTYGKIPRKVVTELAKRGVLPDDIQAIISKYKLIPPTVKTTIVANTDAALNAIDEFIRQQQGKVITLRVQGKQFIQPTATGGLFTGAQTRIIGEAGPEAVVPLNRPLSQVDPSVRWLSAIAQGLTSETQRMARGGVVGNTNQRIVNVEAGAIVVSTPTTDPAAVAIETLNRLVVKI